MTTGYIQYVWRMNGEIDISVLLSQLHPVDGLVSPDSLNPPCVSVLHDCPSKRDTTRGEKKLFRPVYLTNCVIIFIMNINIHYYCHLQFHHSQVDYINTENFFIRSTHGLTWCASVRSL